MVSETWDQLIARTLGKSPQEASVIIGQWLDKNSTDDDMRGRDLTGRAKAFLADVFPAPRGSQ